MKLIEKITSLLRPKQFNWEEAEEASRDLRLETEKFKTKHFQNLSEFYQKKYEFYRELYQVQREELEHLKRYGNE